MNSKPPFKAESPSIDWVSDPAPVLVGDAIARFRNPADAQLALAPSLAIVADVRPRGAVPGEFGARPVFSSGGGDRMIRVACPAGTSLYGTGEVPGRLLRNGTLTICWNTDDFEYKEEEGTHLYQSHPWVLGVRADGSAFGVLIDTTCRCEIALGSAAEPSITVKVDAEAPPFAVYVIERDAPAQVVSALADLTGHMQMPPRWALGYHQCRWSYEPASRVVRLAEEFRNRKMPCDCVWMDIDYMDGFRCFTFDHDKFPDPARLNETLHGIGFKTVWMIDPGIKVDSGYAVYAQGHAGDHFLHTSVGAEYHGTVWPGACAFPDFTRAATRHWWAGLYADWLATGIDGVWNDMNEPAVFDNDDKQMPEDNWHRADEVLGGPGPHRRYHNVYGMLMVRATREGVAASRPTKRPFVLTRSNFLGGHRYAATWTGDNLSNWEHLHWSIPMILNMGISGQPFVGPDIGGFSGNATGPLFARWMGVGALLPFARGHSIKDSADHEPWSFGPECEATCRLALQRRYRLLPYLYTLFWEATRMGLPVARPVFFADPANAALREVDDCFLLGGDVLVRCGVKAEERKSGSPMPRGEWRAFDPTPRHDGHSDPDLPELCFRAGSIVPMGPAVEFADEKPLDPLTLIVTPDGAGGAEGVVYEDAGEGLEYRDGFFRVSTYRAVRDGHDVVVTRADVQGRLHEKADKHHRHLHSRAVEVIVVMADGVRRGSGVDGEAIRVRI